MSILTLSAYGDALGAPYEFNDFILSPGEELVFQPSDRISKNFYASHPGEWTDDTNMAIAITLAALDVSPLQEEEHLDRVAHYFVRWVREYPRGLGNQTGAILRGLEAGNITAETLRQRAKEIFEKHPEGSAGNGSLMRIHPVALFPGTREEVAEAAWGITELTHADPRCLESSVLWVEMLRAAQETGALDPYAGFDLLDHQCWDYWKKVIEEATLTRSEVFSHQRWWVVPTFQQALSAVWHNQHLLHDHPMAVFRELVEAPKGDTDTVCCIAGGLMGALGVSIDQFPADQVSLLHGKWPQHLQVGDLQRLEHQLTRLGD